MEKIEKCEAIKILYNNVCDTNLCKATNEDDCLSCVIYKAMGDILSFNEKNKKDYKPLEKKHTINLDDKFFKCRYCINWCGGEYDKEAPCTVTNKVQNKEENCYHYTINKRKEKEWK